MKRPTRDNQIGLTLDLVLWVRDRRTPFTIHELAEHLGHSVRSAWRYVNALEARGCIRKVSNGWPGRRASWERVL